MGRMHALVLASGLVLARGADADLVTAAMTVVSALVMLRTRLHPLVLIAAGAGIGVARALMSL